MSGLINAEDDLYRSDVVAWLRRQASALRAREAGRNALDYDNLAEEVDGLAASLRNKAFSLTARIIEHLLKLEFVDSPRDRAGWRKEINAFRGSLKRRLSPTIQREVTAELADLFEREIDGLVLGELIEAHQTVRAARPNGYAWEQIVDDRWFPEPRATDQA